MYFHTRTHIDSDVSLVCDFPDTIYDIISYLCVYEGGSLTDGNTDHLTTFLQ